ncbi:Crp/Fnr family transcriptional regulator [Flavobacterium geliluteum]|uniref:Crp/Fnr family transcriptional regulator n=1 Tax=Flavobacterium geliluteum TaxID=2816120 RepID=A0A940X7M1_9FLAO|nr:cyclic nucleotide-binding domain-containing protein [Flavobacterium geliluteum]MBP4138364.1 Crp/Fnr family transcriptional regulator [Flavobacterium geliluteum]
MDNLFRTHLEKIITLINDEFEYLMPHFSLMDFKRRDFLIRKGEKVTYLFWVLSGIVKLEYEDETGKQHLIGFAMEDWWEVDFHAFFNQNSATIAPKLLKILKSFV